MAMKSIRSFFLDKPEARSGAVFPLAGLRGAALLLTWAFALTVTAGAQTTSTIEGTVTDKQGLALAEAEVRTIDSLSGVLEPTLGEDIVFMRVPERISKEVLQTLVGEFTLNDMTATVSLAESSLRLTIPGQPTYELVPTKGLVFDVKGLNGFSVEFRRDASGRISEVVFYQPNGAFIAQKK
jgi:hypothetical protein